MRACCRQGNHLLQQHNTVHALLQASLHKKSITLQPVQNHAGVSIVLLLYAISKEHLHA